MARKYCIIYTSAANVQGFVLTDEEIDSWRQNNPSLRPIYMFRTANDILMRTNKYETDFYTYCYRYGLTPGDLHKMYTNPKNGHDIELLGFNNSNRKYKFIVKDHTDDKQYKVTDWYVKQLEEVGCCNII